MACTPVPRQRLTAGQTVRGAVAPSLAEVWLFEGRAGQRVTISLREDNSGLDPILILVGPDGTELQYDDDGWGYPNAIIQDYRLPQDGTYTITALGFGSSSGAYALTLTDLELTTPTAAPISTSPPAVVQQPITPGQTVSGEILPGGSDLWSFEGAAGQRITITMQEDDSGLDTVLILMGPDGTELRYDDDGWYGFNSIIPDYPLPQDRTYTIMALGYGSSAGAYLLMLADLQATTPTPLPQPTALPTATPTPTPTVLGTVVVNGPPMEGVIIRPGNGDHWQFEGQAQQVVTISMQSLDRHLDPLLTLIDPDGLPLTANDDRRREDVNARIAGYVLPRSGTYRVWADGARDTFGAYTLSISAEPNLMPTPTLSPTPEATLVAQPGDNRGELSPGGHACGIGTGKQASASPSVWPPKIPSTRFSTLSAGTRWTRWSSCAIRMACKSRAPTTSSSACKPTR